jgi:hypothetical protein
LVKVKPHAVIEITPVVVAAPEVQKIHSDAGIVELVLWQHNIHQFPTLGAVSVNSAAKTCRSTSAMPIHCATKAS